MVRVPTIIAPLIQHGELINFSVTTTSRGEGGLTAYRRPAAPVRASAAYMLAFVPGMHGCGYFNRDHLLAIIRKRIFLNFGRAVAVATTPHEPVERIEPGTRVATDGALREFGDCGCWRRGDRCHTLMRHHCRALAVTVSLLGATMGTLASVRVSVTFAGRADLLLAPFCSADLAAISLAAITPSTHREYSSAGRLETLARSKACYMIMRGSDRHLITILRNHDD